MKILRETPSAGNRAEGRKATHRGRPVRSKKAASAPTHGVIAARDLFADWDPASDGEDEDLEILADQAEAHEPGTMAPGNADDEVLREFHRAVTERGGRTLSGRML